MHLYPNPVASLLTIEYTDVVPELIKVYDQNGKELLRRMPTDLKEEIDVSAWPSSLYQVVLITEDQQVFRKAFVKVNAVELRP